MHHQRTASRSIVAALVLTLAACGGESPASTPSTDAAPELGAVDVAADVLDLRDASTDAAPDAPADAADVGSLADGSTDAAPADAGCRCSSNQECVRGACVVCDADGDTFRAAACGGNDCDDTDPAVHPGAFEVCDGRDNDCNGMRDVESNADLGAIACASLTMRALPSMPWSGPAVCSPMVGTRPAGHERDSMACRRCVGSGASAMCFCVAADDVYWSC